MCDLASSQVSGPESPAGLGPRGQRLWEEWTTADAGLGPGHLAVLGEAARCADRLERLDELLRGDAEHWAHLTSGLSGDVRVVVDGVLVEARQQQVTLRALVAELRQARMSRPAPPAGAPSGPTAPPETEDSPHAALARVVQLVAEARGRPAS